jgi:aspartyl-tRNA(Asn)/glutamyl-tRNA(Gln) amidotransferase subunit A
VTPEEARERIRRRSDLNAFISLTKEDGEGPVVAVKDLVDVRGSVTTAGSVILPSIPAQEDARVIRRMREFGCVVVGKTNLHEWAFGVTSNNPHYGAVRNPRNTDLVAGGSSGGSAAAVAAGLCDWAVGTDTGGSIRIPAALCGVVGFKPTIGTVETEGVVPLSRTLDTLGPLAPDVLSAARALEMMSGLTDLVPVRPRPLSELSIAVARGWGEDLAPDLAGPWQLAVRGLPEVELGDPGEMGAPGLTILLAEAARFHAAWMERYSDRYGADVLELLRRGRALTPRDYSRAILEQSRVRLKAEAAMVGWNAVLAPATRVGAPRVGEDYERTDLSGYTRPFNTTGQPVITRPAPGPGMPVGIQVIGHFCQEATLVEAALALETAWSQER